MLNLAVRLPKGHIKDPSYSPAGVTPGVLYPGHLHVHGGGRGQGVQGRGRDHDTPTTSGTSNTPGSSELVSNLQYYPYLSLIYLTQMFLLTLLKLLIMLSQYLSPSTAAHTNNNRQFCFPHSGFGKQSYKLSFTSAL